MESIQEGYGTKHIHLRQTSEDLMKMLGSPTKKLEGDARRVYWIYADRGLETIMSKHTGRTLSLFFKPSKRNRNAAVTARGIRLGDAKAKVVSIYGKPHKSGGGFSLANGDFVGHWFSYRTGVGFHFDHAGYVVTISVFAKSRKREK